MGASSDDDFVADINVTPFVDVMLVLLIIFMVTAPMMTEGLDVALPKVESSEVLPTEDDHLILTIKADGALFLDEYETGLADLPDVLAVQVKGQDRQLFVRADKDVPYGMVMQVMDRIRGAGIADVGLITTSTPVEEPPAAFCCWRGMLPPVRKESIAWLWLNWPQPPANRHPRRQLPNRPHRLRSPRKSRNRNPKKRYRKSQSRFPNRT